MTETAQSVATVRKTSTEGTFTVAGLMPGNYSITVESPGFKKLTRPGIPLDANDKIAIGDLMLDVGSVTDSVEVSAQTAMLQSESVERSATISGKQIENIETNGRNPLDMAKLVPGVSFTNGTSYGDLDPGRMTRYSYRARPRLEQRSAMRRLLRVADDTPLA